MTDPSFITTDSTEPAVTGEEARDRIEDVLRRLDPTGMDGLGPRGWPKHLHRHSDDPEEA